MANHTDEEREQIKEIFKQYDANENGLLEYTEFFHLVESLGQDGLAPKHSPEEIQIAFDKIDKDENGEIDFDEFIEWLFT